MEFYVEGLRSRTLKSLIPKLGKCYVSTLCVSQGEKVSERRHCGIVLLDNRPYR